MYRVLLFSPGFAPYASSANIVNSKLALAMLNRGWEIDVVSAPDLTCMYGQHWGEPWSKLQPITHEIPDGGPSRPVRLAQRVWSSICLGHPIAGCRWARQSLKLAFDLHRRKKYDFVISRCLDEYAHLPAMAFAQRTGVPWLANWNDPPVCSFPPPYDLSLGRLNDWTLLRFCKAAAMRATVNTFPCERLGRYICRLLGVQYGENTHVIPNPLLCELNLQETSSADCFRLCHAGNMSAERDPQTFLLALKRLIEKRTPKIRFEVIGIESTSLMRLAQELGLEKVVAFTGRQSYLDTFRRLAASDVLVIIEAPCQEGVFLPSKFMDYAQVGRPVLSVSPLRGTMEDLLSSRGGGIAVDCTSVDSIYRGLETLYESWQEKALDEYSPRAFQRMYAPEAVVRMYENMFREILDS